MVFEQYGFESEIHDTWYLLVWISIVSYFAVHILEEVPVVSACIEGAFHRERDNRVFIFMEVDNNIFPLFVSHRVGV